MTLQINFHQAAFAEAEDAFTWYEEKEKGLGAEFRKTLDEVIVILQNRPLGSQVIYGVDIRRAVLPRFPFSIIYTVQEDSVLVLAIFHMSRDPKVWQIRS